MVINFIDLLSGCSVKCIYNVYVRTCSAPSAWCLFLCGKRLWGGTQTCWTRLS